MPTHPYLVEVGSRALERQEMQELRVKQNLAGVLVPEAPVAGRQLVFLAKGNLTTKEWEASERESSVYFLPGGRVFLGWLKSFLPVTNDRIS